MIAIDNAYVDAAAPNADAAKNGRGLVLKNKISKLHISDDGALIFAECQGSGKEPYRVSCDFARPDQPVIVGDPARWIEELQRIEARYHPDVLMVLNYGDQNGQRLAGYTLLAEALGLASSNRSKP